MITITAQKEVYGATRCVDTLTVAELISELQKFPQNAKVCISHAEGYMHSCIRPGSIKAVSYAEIEEPNPYRNLGPYIH